MRVRRVRRLERRGLHTARVLERLGACSGVPAGGGPSGGAAVASGGGGGGGGALIPPPPAPERVSGGGGSSSDVGGGVGGGSPDGDGGESPIGDVRGETQSQLPPPIDAGPGRRVEPGGLSLGIGIGLILLALLAGYATPHLRARLRSGRPA